LLVELLVGVFSLYIIEPMAPETSHPFNPEHLAVIEPALNDPTAFAVLVDSLPRIASLIEEAKARGCFQFKSSMRWDSWAAQLCFADFDGTRINKSVSFAKNYEKIARRAIDFETASALQTAVQSLVLASPDVVAFRNIRRRKT
jgi:hypothetical protein